MDDNFAFAPEEEAITPDQFPEKRWKIAIIDDDEDVHQVTKMALAKFEFEGASLEILQGYSAADAKEMFLQHSDIALVLLDVVMEEDHSGLEVIEYIRDVLKNTNTRIVLRTGQPGQAPEKQVIKNYDINDYKEKTELTARKLYTLLFSCLRSYRDIIALENTKRGLEKVINASKNIFEEQYLDEFASGILTQIASIMYSDDHSFFANMMGVAAYQIENEIQVVAGTGEYAKYVGHDIRKIVPREIMKTISSQPHGCYYIGDDFVSIAKGSNGTKKIIYLKSLSIKTDTDRHLLELFTQNVLVAFDNLSLRDEVLETQREVVYRLGEAVETRSKETGNHVKRVAEISKLLALKLGMSKKDAEILKHASPLHDLGKIGIPDAILNKPAKLDPEEWDIMKSHAMIGFNMLNDSKREILKVGAFISKEHHEKWDGTGYPDGISSRDISIESRITSVADVYDALASDRCYKKAWELDDVYSFFKEQKGKQFDPKIVDLMFENLDEINQIRERYVDVFN